MRANHRKAINCLRLKTHERNSDFCFVEEFAAINLNLEFSLFGGSVCRYGHRFLKDRIDSDLIIFTMASMVLSSCFALGKNTAKALNYLSRLIFSFDSPGPRQPPPKTFQAI